LFEKVILLAGNLFVRGFVFVFKALFKKQIVFVDELQLKFDCSFIAGRLSNNKQALCPRH